MLILNTQKVIRQVMSVPDAYDLMDEVVEALLNLQVAMTQPDKAAQLKEKLDEYGADDDDDFDDDDLVEGHETVGESSLRKGIVSQISAILDQAYAEVVDVVCYEFEIDDR